MKRQVKRSWPDRIRTLLEGNEPLRLRHLMRILTVTQDRILDWLMGRKRPSKQVARKIAALERDRERALLAGGPDEHRSWLPDAGRPWYARIESDRQDRLPPLPRQGPLGYERYLDLLLGGANPGQEPPDEEPFCRPGRTSFVTRFRAPERCPKHAVQAKDAAMFLEEATRRFGDEIRSYPLSRVAGREGLGPEEIRILAYLIKQDVGVFEGSGSAHGRMLAQVALRAPGDLLTMRRFLAPEGRLRKSGFLERDSSERGFFFGREESASVLKGSYALSDRAREELLGPLLERSVMEASDDKQGGARKPRFGLDAVVLSSAHRTQIDSLRAELRHRRLLYEEWGLREVLHYGRGTVLLFEGPPGTGKTMLAEALAAETSRPFLQTRFPKLVSKWVGETEKNIARLFRDAQGAGALLFIDEADGILGSREQANHSWEIREVNVLLKAIEDFDGILVLATNNPIVLDDALESRVSLRLTFDLPDAEMRLAIWRKHLPPQLPLAPDVDLELLARRHEISGRDIKQAVLAAARAAVARDGHAARVTMSDLETAAASRRQDTSTAIGFTQPGRGESA
jgi:hypothetical protein